MSFFKLERSFAGLQAGMFGGFVLLAVMALVSVLDRRNWWSYPNLLAAQFYGVRSIGGGAGWPGISGVAFQLLLAACAGALFGGLFGGLGGSRRIVLLGLVWGILVFYASEKYYRVTSPVVAAYLPRSASIVAHMIYGVCLAGIGRIGAAPPPAAELGVRETSHAAASIPQTARNGAGPAGRERTL